VVIGIDGMDPRLLKDYADRGMMPHFAALMARGWFEPLETTIPPQSPVAWSAFITGMDPGGYGIFDFIHRDPKTYLPVFSAARVSEPQRALRIGNWILPLSAGRTELLRKGKAFWQILDQHGVPNTIMRVPANFPPAQCKGRTLSGMGTPDLAGTYGTFSFFTDSDAFDSVEVSGGTVQPVAVKDGRVSAELAGPPNTMKKGHPVMTCPFTVDVDPERDAVRVLIQGETFLLSPGEWSDWVRVHFDVMGPLKRIDGICRFNLRSVRPAFQLYVTPINIDPAHPALPISTPPSFARALQRRIGDFYTQGMPEDTKAFEYGVFGLEDFVSQTNNVLEERWRMLDATLDDFRDGFLFFYVSTIDQSSHMLWREDVQRGTANDADSPAGNRLEHLYANMDSLLGVVEKRIPPNTTLIVMSDHGFAPFDREFNLDTWLYRQGYLALERPGELGRHPLLKNVFWRRTRAYGLGLNGLYLNLLGREGKGIVRPGAEADSLLAEISRKLLALRDPATGEPIVTRVDRAADVYHGDEMANAPDLIVGYNRGYRCSDASALGTLTQGWIETHSGQWSGDHCMDHTLVPGVLLANRPITAPDPSLRDLPVTILALYGIESPAGMHGRVLIRP